MGGQGQVLGTWGVCGGQGCTCFLIAWEPHASQASRSRSAQWEVGGAGSRHLGEGVLPSTVPLPPPPGPKSPAGSAQESWMWWLGVGGLVEGLGFKGPCLWASLCFHPNSPLGPRPLSVFLGAQVWTRGCTALLAALPGWPSVCLPWHRGP